MKKEITSLDLFFLVKELQTLIDAKVDKIYQKEGRFLFQLHLPGKGKKFLRIALPSTLYLSDYKENIEESEKFALNLRKHLSQSRIRKVEQMEFERIVLFQLEIYDKVLKLYVELFKPGNIILCNSDDKIIMACTYKGFGSRIIRPGIVYEYPKQPDTLKLKKDGFSKLINGSDKGSVVKMLATDLSFGGEYAEYICRKAKVDKDTKKLSEKDIGALFKTIQSIKNMESKGYFYEGLMTPVEIQGSSTEYESFNACLDKYLTKAVAVKKTEAKMSKFENEKKKLESILKRQETQIKRFEDSMAENQKKAETIYENYSKVQKMLDSLKKARSEHSWKEIKAMLKDSKIIKRINEKNNEIVIDL